MKDNETKLEDLVDVIKELSPAEREGLLTTLKGDVEEAGKKKAKKVRSGYGSGHVRITVPNTTEPCPEPANQNWAASGTYDSANGWQMMGVKLVFVDQMGQTQQLFPNSFNSGNGFWNGTFNVPAGRYILSARAMVPTPPPGSQDGEDKCILVS